MCVDAVSTACPEKAGRARARRGRLPGTTRRPHRGPSAFTLQHFYSQAGTKSELSGSGTPGRRNAAKDGRSRGDGPAFKSRQLAKLKEQKPMRWSGGRVLGEARCLSSRRSGSLRDSCSLLIIIYLNNEARAALPPPVPTASSTGLFDRH